MPARLVNLQRDLRAAEDDVADPARALRRVQEARRFLADALGVLAQGRAFDDLPAARLIQPDVARKAAILRVAVADRERRNAAPRLRDRLRDARTRRAVEDLVRVPKIHPRAARRHARRRAQERVPLRAAVRRGRRAERSRSRGRRASRTCRRSAPPALRRSGAGRWPRPPSRSRRRVRPRRRRRLRVEHVARREAPRAVDERAYAVSHARLVGERDHGSVAHFDALAAGVVEAYVGVGRAARARGIERACSESVERRRTIRHRPLSPQRNARSPLVAGPMRKVEPRRAREWCDGQTPTRARMRSLSQPASTSVPGATVVAAVRAGS